MSAISESGMRKPKLRWLISRMQLLRPCRRPFGETVLDRREDPFVVASDGAE